MDFLMLETPKKVSIPFPKGMSAYCVLLLFKPTIKKVSIKMPQRNNNFIFLLSAFSFADFRNNQLFDFPFQICTFPIQPSSMSVSSVRKTL